MVVMKLATNMLKGKNFTSLISVFGEKGPNKFSHKGNLLAFGQVALTQILSHLKLCVATATHKLQVAEFFYICLI